MIKRHISELVEHSLKFFPAVLLEGPRQSGKSTFAQQLVKRGFLEAYITLDDLNDWETAKSDPDGFLGQFKGSIAIDEVQRVPDLLRALKKSIDRNKKPGRFFLTGSASVLSYPGVTESLAGRMDILSLEGFSLGELLKQVKSSSFIRDLFSGRSPEDLVHHWNKVLKNKPTLSKNTLISDIFYGGYPDVVLQRNAVFKERWFRAYQTAYVEKDVRDLSKGLDVLAFSKLLKLVILQTGNLLNYNNLGSEVGLDQRTVARYLEMLEITFQVSQLHPWFSNLRKRFVKTPKIFARDSGQVCFHMGINQIDGLVAHPSFGAIFETFIWAELRKLLALESAVQGYFYRTYQGEKVDFILQKGDTLWGIECKWTHTVASKHLKSLQSMLAAFNGQAKGVVIYTGEKVMLLAKDIIAVPVRMLI